MFALSAFFIIEMLVDDGEYKSGLCRCRISVISFRFHPVLLPIYVDFRQKKAFCESSTRFNKYGTTCFLRHFVVRYGFRT